MAIKRLTKSAVEGLKPGGGPYFVWDSGKGCVPGFGVKVLPSGAKVAVFQYRLKGAGRRASARRFTIGAIGPDPAFAKVVAHAKELRASVVLGGDPVRDTKAHALSIVETERLAKERTFKILADAWIDKKRTEDLRTLPQYKRIIKTHLATLHTRDVAMISYADLETLIDDIAIRAPYMARQVVLVLRNVFRLALKRRWITDNIAERIEGGKSAPPGGRTRVLSDDELLKIWHAAEKEGHPFGSIVKLLILTGQRRSEIAELDWCELDIDAALWTIPTTRAKNGAEHIVHLSTQAVELLRSLPAAKTKIPAKGRVFQFNGFTKAKTRLDENAEITAWRLHDIRRSVATGLREMGISQDVTERILNHRGQSRSGIAAVYDKSELLEARKAALIAWGNFIEHLISGKKVGRNIYKMKFNKRA